MPSAFRTPKNLAEWLRLDYFRFPRRLPRLRRALCWATLFVCVAALGAAALNKREPTLYQAGPLSTAHAKFNNDCRQCHQENFATLQRFLPWKNSVSSVPDSACTKCHAGPLHNDKLLPEAKDATCVSCHQEHRGHASLARLPDSTCLNCHRHLKANSTDGEKCEYKDVSGFPEVHPDFRGLSTNPGNIKFNHWAHINLDEDGIPLEDNRHKKDKKDKRALTCSDCHQLDSAGQYIQPIKYETTCKRCHPLSVQLGGEFSKPLQPAEKAFADDPAPHTFPNIVRAVLRDRLLKFVNEHPLQAVEALPNEPQPIPKPKPSLETGLTKMRWTESGTMKMSDADKLAFVQGQLALSEQLCFDRLGGCQLCHIETTPRALSGGLPEFAKSNIPNRWFSHSRFDHRAHRMLDCTKCHVVNEQSNQTSVVMMPNLPSCAECHNPRGGSRSDCLECHIYHPRGHGLEEPRPSSITENLRKQSWPSN